MATPFCKIRELFHNLQQFSTFFVSPPHKISPNPQYVSQHIPLLSHKIFITFADEPLRYVVPQRRINTGHWEVRLHTKGVTDVLFLGYSKLRNF